MNKQRYMVVDDDNTNNMICKFNIKRFDEEADIKIFSMPEEALAFIEEEYYSNSEEQPTILFLDVNMPTMTGWEFLDAFMEFDKFVKNQFTIYILSSSIEDFTEKAENYTIIQAFLSKPLNINNLEEVRKGLLQL